MISGIDLTATIDYTLKDDTENPTIWKLGIMPSYLLAKISGQAGANEIDVAYKILQVSIRGWENFDVLFSTVKEKVFDREIEVVPIALLERIPLNIITELSTKVMEINRLIPLERKN